jgi:hypothetical protein
MLPPSRATATGLLFTSALKMEKHIHLNHLLLPKSYIITTRRKHLGNK